MTKRQGRGAVRAAATAWMTAAMLALSGCGGGGGGSDNTDGTDNGSGSGSTNPTVPAAQGSYAVVAWNDLGMHCVDGKDYSVFSILPPYNNLRAQVLRRDASGSQRLVTSGITLTYEAVTDASGSINTGSTGKTNFWAWAPKLFGAAPAADVGLTGQPTPSAAPAPLRYAPASGRWEATGIPITPYDDAGAKNTYPMVKVVARDGTGTALASTRVVLPVSDEMSCKSCHASASGYAAARPAAGWVNDADAEKDWKKNILRLHDEQFPAAIATAGKAATYAAGSLLGSALAGQPVLCANCHQSNALGTPPLPGVLSLTASVHARHAAVAHPTTGAPLDGATTRDTCYLCHPGSVTRCLRGAMGNAVGSNGLPTMDCQSCHGNLSRVGNAARQGWLDEPNCQGCHDRAGGASQPFTRYTSVFGSGNAVRATIDPLFATNANAPSAGRSLFRESTGHGGMQCEACHGATHAEYPSSHANDNVQSISLQGYAGTLRECSVCHANVPLSTNGGPHGMHTVGSGWVSAHGGRVESSGSAACTTCHGADYRGGVLSQVKAARTLGRKAYAAGQAVGCYDCHDGPRGG